MRKIPSCFGKLVKKEWEKGKIAKQEKQIDFFREKEFCMGRCSICQGKITAKHPLKTDGVLICEKCKKTGIP